MTRRRDLMLEDLFGCAHEPEIPICEGDTILYWRCTCGARQVQPADATIKRVDSEEGRDVTAGTEVKK